MVLQNFYLVLLRRQRSGSHSIPSRLDVIVLKLLEDRSWAELHTEMQKDGYGLALCSDDKNSSADEDMPENHPYTYITKIGGLGHHTIGGCCICLLPSLQRQYLCHSSHKSSEIIHLIDHNTGFISSYFNTQVQIGETETVRSLILLLAFQLLYLHTPRL